MSLPILVTSALLLLFFGYRVYGKFISRQYQLNDAAVTPSERFKDGIDFVPTKPAYLLGQHFSAIAAAGPIAGPILACQQFGWLPCLLWIALGVVLIGAVHDFSSLIVSVRHGAQSIAEIVRKNIGKRAWLAVMLYIWLTLIYVIVAFTEITAGTFVGRIEELEGIPVQFERGGAVAAASTLYLLLALVMGLIQKKWNPPLWLLTIVFVPATLGAVWMGTRIGGAFVLPQGSWNLIILIYCLIASITPVWLLLQSRGYLGGFVLYMALAVGVIGIFFGGYEINQSAFKTFNAGGLNGALFPFLFVTIACGACSGFHGLVCSGTTSKQIAKESHCKPIGYGGMLLEAFVAVIALTTIMILPQEKVTGAPGAIYGAGIGQFLTVLIGKENLLFAITFGAMAFSTFVFDTLDVTTRLGRYILQELIGRRGWVSTLLTTLVTVGAPAVILLTAPKGAWLTFWVLFGSANQLLAALTLLVVSVWLKNTGRRCWFTLIPSLFLFAITLTSLKKIAAAAQAANSLPALVMIGLAIYIIVESILAMNRKVERRTIVEAGS